MIVSMFKDFNCFSLGWKPVDVGPNTLEEMIAVLSRCKVISEVPCCRLELKVLAQFEATVWSILTSSMSS